MKLPSCLSEHPESVGETYTGHWLHASAFAGRLLLGGLACLVHAFLPFLFVHTASRCVAQLHATLSARNHGQWSRGAISHGNEMRSQPR